MLCPLAALDLALWSGRHLALAIDVTNLGERFHVLCVSVVVRGVGIPVAWKVLWGGQKEPWNPHWQRLLQLLQQAVPADWTVLVLSDRGLESPVLFEIIRQLHWHPLMRVKKGGKFRPEGWSNFYFMEQLAHYGDGQLAVAGWAYGPQDALRLAVLLAAGLCRTVVAVDRLASRSRQRVWYGLRSWIEAGFKVIKGGAGLEWRYRRMEDPERVERLWLVLAVATVWVVALGVAAEVRERRPRNRNAWRSNWRRAKSKPKARQERRRRGGEQSSVPPKRGGNGGRGGRQRAQQAAGGQEEAETSQAGGQPAARNRRRSNCGNDRPKCNGGCTGCPKGFGGPGRTVGEGQQLAAFALASRTLATACSYRLDLDRTGILIAPKGNSCLAQRTLITLQRYVERTVDRL